ncbi:hypothetical protein [Streptomyces antarcticus]|uniref:hypothetical protein n=1 Tax=Streptomyces antarcticus TaxID=2996458 RepID=UPI002271E903|nr:MULTISPECIES: hypothetical protein [unclassified Streptomyces]MCY0947224.1 hypothetical protein [Streptomyces sp. H34-AA3]MCZ4086388.1 hypothetical protein [Streptomyces sp. H34-S5]
MTDDHTPLCGAGEEQALRGLLHGAVEGLEPSEGALERLRYAVPARRSRRRRAVVGAAAAALLAGAGIPAAVHLSGGGNTAADRSAMARHGERSGATAGTASSDPHQNGAGAHPRATRSPGAAPDAGGTTGEPDQAATGSSTGGTGASAGPSGAGTPSGSSLGQSGQLPVTGPQPPAAQGVGRCGADQLGVVASARAPEADGRVYGSFKVTNVSVRGCIVSGADRVTAAAAAPGTGTGTAVVGHTAGDPASGLLPDPSAAPPLLVLQPNTAYEVRFAWVPSGESCPAATPAGPKPPQGDSADGAGAAPGGADGTGGTAGAGPDPQTGPPSPDPAGVAVAHTPVAGSPTTQTTIPEACGGTLYRTGSIPLDAPAP